MEHITTRFWKYVNFNGPVPEYRPDLGPCWLWTGRVNGKGYGRIIHRGRQVSAPRTAYELESGQPFPDGKQPDHLCRVRLCVRPAHLDPVTNRENVLRGINRNRDKTHCRQGHALAGDNLILRTNRGWKQRECRACGNSRARAYKRRMRKAAA